MPSLANDAYLLEKAGAEAEAKRNPGQQGLDRRPAPAQSSSELVSKIEDAITRGTNVIAINAGDPKPVIPALKRAVQQGVKVVVFDVPIPELTDQSSFVGLDNRQGGELAGKWLAAHAGLRRAARHPALHPRPADHRRPRGRLQVGARQRAVQGRLDARRQVRSREGRDTTMENMLSSHPDLDAIYSISDTQTFGAVKAITAVHKDPIVVSFDAQPEALKDIKAGTVIDASVGQFPFKVGALAVKTAVAVAEGKTVDKQVISPLVMVDKTNVDQFTADQRQLP